MSSLAGMSMSMSILTCLARDKLLVHILLRGHFIYRRYTALEFVMINKLIILYLQQGLEWHDRQLL